MKNFKHGDRPRGDRGGSGGFGRPHFSGKPRFGGGGGFRDREAGERFQAVCAKCGKSCEVPFRPNGKKPVYCNECFGGQGGGGDREQSRDFAPPRQFDRPRPTMQNAPSNTGSMERSLAEISRKLDILIRILDKKEKPEQSVASRMPDEPKLTKRPDAVVDTAELKKAIKKSGALKKKAK